MKVFSYQIGKILIFHFILLLFISTPTFGQPNIVISNVFTPNNDSFNDVFPKSDGWSSIFNTITVTSLNCKIYNRWGILVSELTKPNEVWDGRTISGIECSTGVYYYVVIASDEIGEYFDKKGYVQLIK